MTVERGCLWSISALFLRLARTAFCKARVQLLALTEFSLSKLEVGQIVVRKISLNIVHEIPDIRSSGMTMSSCNSVFVLYSHGSCYSIRICFYAFLMCNTFGGGRLACLHAQEA